MSRRIAFIGALALVVPFLLVTQAQAVSTDVVISHVYGGGGNSGATYTHDFVELFNRGSTSVSLAGMSVQYTSSTSTGNFGANSNQLTLLSGTVSPGQRYLVQLAKGAGGTTPLPTPDATGTIAMGNSGKVALVNSMTGLGCNGSSTPCTPAQLVLIRDLIGYGDANFFEGSGPAPALINTTAALRLSGGCTDTDNNAADFAAVAPNPRNTASAATPCTGPDAAPAVSSTAPANGASMAPNANLTVTFSEPVNLAGSWFSLTCATSGSVAGTVSGGPSVFTIDPAADFLHGETCLLTVLASQVSDQDSDDPPDNMAADHLVAFTVIEPCQAAFTPIPSIQGSGSIPAITGNVTTKGVVTADLEGASKLGGFYLQDPAGDADPATSDGIFVYTGTADLVSAGQVVRVTGYARDRYGQTTINGSNADASAVTDIVSCGTGSVTPTQVTLPFAEATTPERYEGMLVRLPQDLVISDYYDFDRYGEIVLALPLPGESRLFTGTALDEPGAAATARTQANALRRIRLDDNSNSQNPAALRHPNGELFSLANRFRGGDTVTDTLGILGYDFSAFRVYPTAGATYTAVSPRASAPTGGKVRVASVNASNYFLTDGSASTCGPSQDMACRGWDDPGELARQRDKLLAALTALDADVIGLTEIENTSGVEPLADLVAGLPGYSFVDTGTIGTDAIKPGLLYRTATVTPVGAFAVLDLGAGNRPALAQTFRDAAGERFTVVVNHFKSKGSACVGDPDTGDGQGECNLTRTAAAKALVDWVASDPTGSGDADVLLIGDFNSYTLEDPIDALVAGADDTAGTGDDFTNLIKDPFSYTYRHDVQARSAGGVVCG
ncbi:MAG: ExeM/NucH family extracellular endonuclease [Candidatus Nanopelagicales bacterium]|nr:ExeM/NucH family extracellular endonuclease [Candidatus Nanopelagicales bacterium]